MMPELKAIGSDEDYKSALAEAKRLWGVKSRTPEGDRLELLATLIDAYENARFPMDPT